MAHAPAAVQSDPPNAHAGGVSPALQAHPVTPGKVAMWLFLATEVMFFTGLIGTYIVLRAGTPAGSYSELYPPGTRLAALGVEQHGIIIDDLGADPHKIIEIYRRYHPDLDEHAAEHALEWLPNVVAAGLTIDQATKLEAELRSAGATVRVAEPVDTSHAWPPPYNNLTNPLSINLTAANTFILICSSVSMVLALAAIQRGDRAKLNLWLLATVLIGSVFLGVQVYEYYQLMYGHHYPPGISADGHFRPSRSLFASCFFTMTGFHGAHVAGGIIALSSLLCFSVLTGKFSRENHSPVELIGLYWHFVDLVWIILFTVVYLI